MTNDIVKEGRPSKYSDEIVDYICTEIENGKSLIAICGEIKIDYSTITKWLREKPEFSVKYARAREAQANYGLDKIQNLSEEPAQVYYDDKKGSYVIDPAWVSYQKLKVDTEKWRMGKMLPKVYGDKLQVAGDKENPVTIRIIDDVK